jgi:DNA-binding GntR family transcriptional regulator
MVHQYLILKAILIKKILKGNFLPGDILPSENELAIEHNLSRSTVRQALDELVKERYIYKHKGKGSIVLEPKRQSLGLFSIKGFSESLAETASIPKTIFLENPKHIEWEEDFFFPLTDDEKLLGCLLIKRLRLVEDNAVMLENTYIPDIGLPLVSKSNFINNSLFETLAQNFGIKITMAEQELLATQANVDLAEIFKIEMNSPLLHVFRKYHTTKQGLFIYSSFFCNTQQYSIGNIIQ